MDASRCRYPPLCSSDELVLRLSKLTPPILRPHAGLQLAYRPILRPWAGLHKLTPLF